MSDQSQTIVDLDATPAQATMLAKTVLNHLVGAGVVLGRRSECTLGEPGHAPGPKSAGATKGRESVDDELETNGVEICVGRAVFDTGENGIELRCAACKKVFEPGAEYMELAEAWFAGDDDVEFACPKCTKARRLVEWDGPSAMGFGNLGLTFWNWPELSASFVKEIADLLGHRVRVVRQHL